MLLLILLFGIFCCVYGCLRKHRWLSKDPFFVSSLFIIPLTLLICLMIYFGGVATITELKAWNLNNAFTAKTSIEAAMNEAIVFGHLAPSEREELLEQAIIGGAKELLNLDNFQQSSKITEMIKDYRDKMIWYNEELQYYSVLQNHWVLWPFIPRVPAYLEPMDY